MKRKIASFAAVLLVACTGLVVWAGRRLPPPRLILKYGPPPEGGPTGTVRKIDGIAFVEIAPGYAHIRREIFRSLGNLPGRCCAPLELDFGAPDVPWNGLFVDEWVEIPRRIWISYSALPSPDPEAVCSKLAASAGGQFRPATREEIYVAATGHALDTQGMEVEFDPTERNRVLLTGADWDGVRSTEVRMFGRGHGVRTGVRLAWIPPDAPSVH